MKKRVLFVVFITLCLTVFMIPPFNASADENLDPIREIVPEEYGDLFDFSEEDPSGVLGKLDGQYFLSLILSCVRSSLGDCLALLSALVGIAAAGGIFECFSSSLSSSLKSAFSFVLKLTGAMILIALLKNEFSSISESIGKTTLFIGKFIPVLSSVSLASANVTGAAVSAAHFALIMSILGTVSGEILMPFLRICTEITVISALSKKKEIASLSSFLCKTFTSSIGIIMTVITTVFAYQTSISASTDALAIRSARLASSSIPVVGSAISEASRTILGSMNVLKSISGGVGIALVMLTFLPTIISLLLKKTVLSLASSVSSALSCDELSSLISSLSSILGYGIAVLAVADVTVIISVVLMMMNNF